MLAGGGIILPPDVGKELNLRKMPQFIPNMALRDSRYNSMNDTYDVGAIVAGNADEPVEYENISQNSLIFEHNARNFEASQSSEESKETTSSENNMKDRFSALEKVAVAFQAGMGSYAEDTFGSFFDPSTTFYPSVFFEYDQKIWKGKIKYEQTLENGNLTDYINIKLPVGDNHIFINFDDDVSNNSNTNNQIFTSTTANSTQYNDGEHFITTLVNLFQLDLNIFDHAEIRESENCVKVYFWHVNEPKCVNIMFRLGTHESYVNTTRYDLTRLEKFRNKKE